MIALHKRFFAALPALAALLLAACAPAPLRTGLPSEWTPSPSFGERRPNFVVLHHTTNDNAARAIATLTNPALAVSAHYLVGRDGRIHQLVDERMRAWHAGASNWGGVSDMNSASIGIELDNTGAEAFAEPQMTTLIALLTDLRERYKIPAANVIGHGDVAPGRKVDPSHLFPWRRLAAAGFGLWCEPPYAPVAPPPAGADDALLLQATGYDTTDLPAAINAFRRHFRGDPSLAAAAGGLSDEERALARCLASRRREPGG
jgi:N-acetylmuramoyl-L-alanine amidase